MNLLRPIKLADIIGQEVNVKTLRILAHSALKRQDVIPHILFEGPPGLGKTTLAKALSNTIAVNFVEIQGSSLSAIKKVEDIVKGLEHRNILFIDEIHRVSKVVQEYLYPVMEDYTCGHFTLIGATTHSGLLNPPFLDRFTMKIRLTYYSEEDMVTLIKASAKKLEIELTDDVPERIARVSRGTPRIANSYMIWLMNYSFAYSTKITPSVLGSALLDIGVTSKGFTTNDVLALDTIASYGTISLSSLAAATGIAKDTLQYEVEPYLIRMGMIKITARGRSLCQ